MPGTCFSAEKRDDEDVKQKCMHDKGVNGFDLPIQTGKNTD